MSHACNPTGWKVRQEDQTSKLVLGKKCETLSEKRKEGEGERERER
jgi:hypothetical protein